MTLAQQKEPYEVQDTDFNKLWKDYWLSVQAVGPLTYTRFRLMLKEITRSKIAPPEVILDVGCGSGGMMSLLQRRFPRAKLFGIEPSSVARSALPGELYSQVFAGGILEVEAQLPQQMAQLIICSEVLEHVPAPEQIVASIARLAAPGALCLLTVPSGMHHWSVQDSAAGHLRRFEPNEFELLLKSANLEILNLSVWGGPVSATYNWIINTLGPTNAAACGQSRWGRGIARFLTTVLRLDDYLSTDRGFQLVAAARKL